MTDVTLTLTIDNTDSLLSIAEVEAAADKATQRLAILRRKALSQISMTMSMITQTYGTLKQLLRHTDQTISPIFDAMFSTVAAVVSTAVSSAIMLMSSLHPALVIIGVTLMVVSLELQIKANMDLIEAQKKVKSKIYTVPDYGREAFRSIRGGFF